jgi:hypothetical protein
MAKLSTADLETYNRSVFINCPFDKTYRDKTLRAITFTVVYCGFNPCCALENISTDEARVGKIYELIKKSRFGIHDLRKTGLDKHGLPRFNMPFELGVFIGMKESSLSQHKNKKALILVNREYEYKIFLSDLSGQDLGAHGNKVLRVIQHVRGWLIKTGVVRTYKNKRINGENIILRDFELFNADLEKHCKDSGTHELTYEEFVDWTKIWFQESKTERFVKIKKA